MPRQLASRTSGSSSPRSRSTSLERMRSICSASLFSRTTSTTFTCGIAKRSCATETISDGMIASVSGRWMTSVVPSPIAVSTSIWPPRFWMFVRTTSMPTPRPEKSEISSTVDRPGWKISRIASFSESPAPCSRVIAPRAMADSFTRSGSMPRPSSFTSITTRPRSWYARTETRPVSGLPSTARPFGSSSPWSRALRSMWVIGSASDSMIERSSSTSPPEVSSSTFLPSFWAMSRTRRGMRSKSTRIGCIRVFMMFSCSSVVTRSRFWRTALTPGCVERSRSWRI